jgi:hypothetical protein
MLTHPNSKAMAYAPKAPSTQNIRSFAIRRLAVKWKKLHVMLI